jgi:hypothetical protein
MVSRGLSTDSALAPYASFARRSVHLLVRIVSPSSIDILLACVGLYFSRLNPCRCPTIKQALLIQLQTTHLLTRILDSEAPSYETDVD